MIWGYPGYPTFKKDSTLMLQWNIQIPDWETHFWLGVGGELDFSFPWLHGKSGTLLQHAPSKNWSTWIWTWYEYEWSLLYDYGLWTLRCIGYVCRGKGAHKQTCGGATCGLWVVDDMSKLSYLKDIDLIYNLKL